MKELARDTCLGACSVPSPVEVPYGLSSVAEDIRPTHWEITVTVVQTCIHLWCKWNRVWLSVFCCALLNPHYPIFYINITPLYLSNFPLTSACKVGKLCEPSKVCRQLLTDALHFLSGKDSLSHIPFLKERDLRSGCNLCEGVGSLECRKLSVNGSIGRCP